MKNYKSQKKITRAGAQGYSNLDRMNAARQKRKADGMSDPQDIAEQVRILQERVNMQATAQYYSGLDMGAAEGDRSVGGIFNRIALELTTEVSQSIREILLSAMATTDINAGEPVYVDTYGNIRGSITYKVPDPPVYKPPAPKPPAPPPSPFSLIELD